MGAYIHTKVGECANESRKRGGGGGRTNYNEGRQGVHFKFDIRHPMILFRKE